MSDDELLDRLEHRLFDTMFEGCLMDNHLGRTAHYPGEWSVSMRADQLSRLIDMARREKE
jgi:hypothetical protein